MYVDANSNLELDGVVVTQNKATAVADGANLDGGGIYNVGALIGGQSTISDNVASDEGSGSAVVGGGIFNDGDLVVDRSTISGNQVLLFGSSNALAGGIFTGINGTFSMTLSTVSGNTVAAQSTGTVQVEGGGIFGNTPNPTITASTIASNSASDGATSA